MATDLIGDGEIDLLTSSQDAGTIARFENDGNQDFTERVLDTTAAGTFSFRFDASGFVSDDFHGAKGDRSPGQVRVLLIAYQ